MTELDSLVNACSLVEKYENIQHKVYYNNNSCNRNLKRNHRMSY